MAPKFHTLTIANIEPLTVDAKAISFAVPKALKEDYRFTPGQYLTLRSDVEGDDVRRSYSISSPLGNPVLTVGIRQVEEGVFSTFATQRLKVGDRVKVMTPQGNFTARTGGGETYLLVAAGSGITPMMSIARSSLEASPDARVTLVYGNRNSGTVMFREALEALKDRYMERFTLIHILSREDQDVPVLNGRIDAEKLMALTNTAAINPSGADAVYLCGPGEMIDEAKTALEALGVEKSRVHFELFTPADGSEPRKAPTKATEDAVRHGATVEVILDGSRRSFHLASAEETVLDAAKREGLELPFSCKGGMCCTCRCKVLDGAAEMAVNYSLEPWEIKAGFTLACQARPTSAKLVLDFDEI